MYAVVLHSHVPKKPQYMKTNFASENIFMLLRMPMDVKIGLDRLTSKWQNNFILSYI
jgi:hypothetical protein